MLYGVGVGAAGMYTMLCVTRLSALSFPDILLVSAEELKRLCMGGACCKDVNGVNSEIVLGSCGESCAAYLLAGPRTKDQEATSKDPLSPLSISRFFDKFASILRYSERISF